MLRVLRTIHLLLHRQGIVVRVSWRKVGKGVGRLLLKRLGLVGLDGVCGRGRRGAGSRGTGNDGDRLGLLVVLVVFLGMDLLVLLEVLGTLERLGANLKTTTRVRRGKEKTKESAHLARMRFEVDVNARVAREVVSLRSLGRASRPVALETEGSGALASDVTRRDVLVCIAPVNEVEEKESN